MDRTMRVTIWVVLIFAATAVLWATGAAAREGQTRTVQLTPSQNSGVGGTATFRDSGGGVEVGLGVRGLPEAGVKHINHVHGGATCADERAGRGAPATIPLKTLVAGENGRGEKSTSLENVTVDQLFDPAKERYVLVHAKAKEGEGIPPGIACADLVRSGGGGANPEVAADEQSPSKFLPDTGGPRVADLVLPAAAVLALLGLAVLRSLKGGI